MYGLTYYGEPIRRFPWTWSVIRPQWRFVWTVGDRSCIATDENLVYFCIQRAYEQEIRAELIDPEWPSEYWDRKEGRDL